MQKNLKENKVVALVQARSTSMRFPKKVLGKINKYTIIELIFLRLNKSKYINEIILVTSKDKSDDKLSKIIEDLGFNVFRGSLDNVLDRYYKAAKLFEADIIVRITGDCPVIDTNITDKVIHKYLSKKLDYCSTVIPPTFPDGFDTEVFSPNQTMKKSM